MVRPVDARRRAFLKSVLAAPVLASCRKDEEPAAPPGQWRNWSGAQRCTPKGGLQMPASVEELGAVVKAAKGPVRVAGAGHSFSGVVPTDDMLLSTSSGVMVRQRVAAVPRQSRAATGVRVQKLDGGAML